VRLTSGLSVWVREVVAFHFSLPLKMGAARLPLASLQPTRRSWSSVATFTGAGLAERVTASLAAIEALPFEDASVDAIWCHDVLNHVDLPRGLAECARVLKPGSPMFVFVTLATDRCEPKEAARLWASMAIVPENMQSDYLEGCARAAGFEIAARERIDSERRERRLEAGETGMLSALLRLARMRRRDEELVRRYGRPLYEATYGSDLWGVYQMLGKLCPIEYVLRKL